MERKRRLPQRRNRPHRETRLNNFRIVKVPLDDLRLKRVRTSAFFDNP